MEDVSYISQNVAVLDQLKATGAHTLREQDLMNTLQLVMGTSAAKPSSGVDYSNHQQWVIGLRYCRTVVIAPSGIAMFQCAGRLRQRRGD